VHVFQKKIAFYVWNLLEPQDWLDRPTDLMIMSKYSQRESRMKQYDSIKMCIQWMNNRSISLTSPLEISGEVVTYRRSDSTVFDLMIEKRSQTCQDRMDSVDQSNQYGQRGADIAVKPHYKSNTKTQFVILYLWS
jgi:hypothetical protein